MKNITLSILTILLIITTSQFNLMAQGFHKKYYHEMQEALSGRTEDERKVSTSLFTSIFLYKKALSDGATKGEVIEGLFDPSFLFIDDQDRLQVMIRFKPGMSNEKENVKEMILRSGGLVRKTVIGHNSCLEIYSWLPIDKIINLASNPGVGFIEVVVRSMTRYTTAGDDFIRSVTN